MPTEIVIVRHGQSTGNAADRASYKGDHSLFTQKIRNQKSLQWPLTIAGVKESKLAGNYIRNNIIPAFDYYFTSNYVRAIETASHMGFEGSHWIEDPLLREREWGGSENLPYPERNELFRRFGMPLTENSLSWHPPDGEDMFAITKKIKLFLKKVQTFASKKRILLVSHSAPLQAFRVLQHHINPVYYEKFINEI